MSELPDLTPPAPPLRGLAPSPIAERILDAFPSSAYALAALLRLMDITETESVPTAAVECRAQPRLLINPRFVARHAATPEKLIALVMHELHHVLLGHTTLFPRVTPVQNFVFDAVINGLVCRMFPDPQFVSFFTDFYRAEAFPECLLRPAPGWPDDPRDPPGIDRLHGPLRRQAAELHRALYSATGATYREVFDALLRLITDLSIAAVPLLGGHGSGDAPNSRPLDGHSPLLFETVRSIVEHWPQPPDPIRGRSLAGLIDERLVRVSRPATRRAVLRTLIRKVAGASRIGHLTRISAARDEAATPIPTLARRDLVQRLLGSEALLHTGQSTWRQRRRQGEKVHVYLDVSGSMDAVKGPLYGAVLDCQELVHPNVHLFSTMVSDVSLAELRRGICRSTGGTDIACVAEHMADRRIHRALIITDGWVGTPNGQHLATLQQARIAVAWLGVSIDRQALGPIADYSSDLPLAASR